MRHSGARLLAWLALALGVLLCIAGSLGVARSAGSPAMRARATPTVAPAPASAATNGGGRLPPTPLWSLGADVALPQYNDIDIEPGILNVNGTIWMIYSDGGNTWRRFAGPTLDTLVQLPPAQRDASFNQPYGDDRYWISGLWSDGATWYATVHIEFHYHSVPNASFNWFRRIGLATSTDQGATWHYAGDIITGPHSVNIADYPGDKYDWGDGDQKFFVDAIGGYFYIYYETGWIWKATGAREQFIDVARCPLAAKLAPGCWTKWYQGAWSQPGLGGLDSAVFVHVNSVAVVYSTALRAFVALGNGPGFISVATNLTAQDWSPPAPFASDAQLEWYEWPVDPATGDRMTVGGTFRLYLAQSGVGVDTRYLTVVLRSAVRPQIAIGGPVGT